MGIATGRITPVPAQYRQEGAESLHVWGTFRVSCWWQRTSAGLGRVLSAVVTVPQVCGFGHQAGCLPSCTIPDTASLPSTPDVFPTALVSRRSCVPHPSVTNSSGAGTLSLCLPRTPGGRLLAPWRSILPPSRWQEEQQQRKLPWLLLLQCRAIVREFSCKL